LITSDFPMVAWSAVLVVAVTGRGVVAGSLIVDAGGGAMEGRSGSFGRLGVIG
jgi:hypothetical protein